MSKAYICDKCGLIVPEGGQIRGVWTHVPFLDISHRNPDLHLCDECFEQFEREYTANLRGENVKTATR